VNDAQGFELIDVHCIAAFASAFRFHTRHFKLRGCVLSISNLLRNNPSVTFGLVDSSFTSMSFKDYLRQQLDERGMRPAELARLSGVTKQNIGRILNDTRHPISGGLPQVTRETVEKLAKALGADLNEALLAAGFAPLNSIGPPTNAAEFLEAIKRIGVPVEFMANLEGLENLTPDDYQRLLDSVAMSVEVSIRQLIKTEGVRILAQNHETAIKELGD
jgi:transcriptional regulator with XRE-family HTH domain